MRNNILALSLILVCASPVSAASNRTLEGEHLATSVDQVILEVGVGDVEILASSDDTIRYSVTLRPRRGGFFSSMKRGEREVENAVLEADQVGSKLQLKIESDSDERRFEEDWTLEMPVRLAFELDLGVGDVEIRDREGRVDIEAGVGDILIENVHNSISVEAGVGDVVINGNAAQYSYVESSAGVGDARIRVQGKRIDSDGFVGHSTTWSGNGKHRVSIEVGVGDARITLD